MTKIDEKSFDFLTGREADFTKSVMDELANTAWAKPLINDINASGGLVGKNKAKLFELRFGHSLHKAGIAPRYETPGEAESTLDYSFSSGGRDFLVEMMRLEETKAARDATAATKFEDGDVMVARSLGPNAENPERSLEGETLKAVERICQKFEQDGKPHKFPKPSAATHVVLVDFRNFRNGGDDWDRLHVGLGGESVPIAVRRYWKRKLPTGEWERKLITGVFDPGTTMKGAAEARERVHLIGFVNEQSYETGGFGPAIQFVANPHLFKTPEEARAVLTGWPLGEPHILFPPAAARVGNLVNKLSAITVA